MERSQKLKKVQIAITVLLIVADFITFIAMLEAEVFDNATVRLWGFTTDFDKDQSSLALWVYLMISTVVVWVVDFVLSWMVSNLEVKEKQLLETRETNLLLKQMAYKNAPSASVTAPTQSAPAAPVPAPAQPAKPAVEPVQPALAGEEGAVFCPQCGKKQAANRKVCFFCETPFASYGEKEAYCTKCGTKLTMNNTYCATCGEFVK